MTSKPGEWFTAAKVKPAEGVLLFLETQAGEPADSGYFPQPPVPPGLTDRTELRGRIAKITQQAKSNHGSVCFWRTVLLIT